MSLAILSQFYQSAIHSGDDRLQSIRRKSNGLSLLRLLLFGGLVFTLWFLFRQFSVGLLLLAVVLAASFLVCVNLYFRLKEQAALWEKLLFVNTNEKGLLEGSANHFPDGRSFLDPDNYLDDLDIFGPASVFYVLNRTTTLHGEAALTALLRQSLLSVDEIGRQQAAIQALAIQSDLRRLLTAKGLLTGDRQANLHNLTGWLNMEPRLYHRKGLRIGIGILTLANLAALLYSFSSGNYTPLVIAIVVCRLLTGYFSKSVSRQHQLISNKQPIFEQYADILLVFSTADPGSSPMLEQLRSRSQEAHTAIRRLSRLTSFFDQRMNLLVNLILNSLAFYDLQCMVALERWKARYKADFPAWVEAVGQIECLNSLATFAFNHPEYAYPLPVGSAGGPGSDPRGRGDLFIEATQLAHPLIPAKRRVANDFSIGRDEKLILVTGSNMSGKTTFLRTVGVNLLLAQCGAPVCAGAFSFTPMQLLTSLRISDSLQEQTSYFMAELKKLFRIIQQLETGTPALVLIDEILRGTNSEDKTYGSEQFARRLAGYRCLSLFATHDLSLGQLEQELPGVIANYCFESVIEDGDLHFNYRLQKGIARNRNASFLMKKMKII
jgi:hypothetical protein